MAAAAALASSAAHASLLAPGICITDTATDLEFVSPFATRGVSPDNVSAGCGGCISAGFEVATSAELLNLIDSNFGIHLRPTSPVRRRATLMPAISLPTSSKARSRRALAAHGRESTTCQGVCAAALITVT